MRYAIIGDIHGNLDALRAVLGDIDGQKVDSGACVGDIVGYGAEPAECVEEILRLGWPCVAGNHDYAVAGRLRLDFFNAYARAAILWTRKRLSQSEMDYLGALKLVETLDGITLVHSTLDSPENFGYILTLDDAYGCFRFLKTDICFLGHSHVPVTFLSDGENIEHTMGPIIALAQNRRAVVNVGSVGQPRDFNPKASYAIYDEEEGRIQIRRVSYDVGGAAKKIIAAGLPEVLAERLFDGC